MEGRHPRGNGGDERRRRKDAAAGKPQEKARKPQQTKITCRRSPSGSAEQKTTNDMFRQQLSAALETAVREAGYAFYRGFEYRLNEKPLRFPAAWCAPPKMIRIDGRREGEATYRVTLHLMEKNLRYDETLKEQAWDRMERDALRIIRRAESCDEMFCAENIALTPAEFSLTVHGELSMKAEFDIRTDFRTEDKNDRP